MEWILESGGSGWLGWGVWVWSNREHKQSRWVLCGALSLNMNSDGQQCRHGGLSSPVRVIAQNKAIELKPCCSFTTTLQHRENVQNQPARLESFHPFCCSTRRHEWQNPVRRSRRRNCTKQPACVELLSKAQKQSASCMLFCQSSSLWYVNIDKAQSYECIIIQLDSLHKYAFSESFVLCEQRYFHFMTD